MDKGVQVTLSSLYCFEPSKKTASETLEEYISDFERTNSEITDYQNLPSARKSKKEKLKKDKTRDKDCNLDDSLRRMRLDQADEPSLPFDSRKDFYQHLIDCVDELKINAQEDKAVASIRSHYDQEKKLLVGTTETAPKSKPRSPSWIDDADHLSVSKGAPSWLEAISGLSDVATGTTTKEGAPISTIRTQLVSSQKIKHPSWIDAVKNEKGATMRIPSWIETLSSQDSAILTDNGVDAVKTPSDSQADVSYHDRLEHLFRQQDLRLQRLKLRHDRFLRAKATPTKKKTFPQNRRTRDSKGKEAIIFDVGGRAADRAFSKSGQIKRGGSIPAPKSNRVSEKRSEDPSARIEVGSVETATDVLLSKSAYGRKTFIGSRDGLHDRELERSKTWIQDPDSDDDKRDENAESTLQTQLDGDRSWERRIAVRHDPDKRPVEKLKNMLFVAQAHVALEDVEIEVLQSDEESRRIEKATSTRGESGKEVPDLERALEETLERTFSTEPPKIEALKPVAESTPVKKPNASVDSSNSQLRDDVNAILESNRSLQLAFRHFKNLQALFSETPLTLASATERTVEYKSGSYCASGGSSGSDGDSEGSTAV